MLVVTSNWAIGDGTLLRPFAAWRATLPAAIHRAAVRGGFRRDGGYRPIDGLDLVVAGDTFDWLLSAEWCGDVRPWHGGVRPRETRLRIAERSARSARRLFATLARWVRHGLPVPADDGRGRPGRTGVSVPVRVTLLAGDRDFALIEIARHATRMPFAIGERWENADVSIRHGHDLDPACHRGDARAPTASDDRSPTLAESVAVDLVARFAATVGRGAAAGAAAPLLRALAACPVVEIPCAIAAWLRQRPHSAPLGIEPFDEAWRRAVAAWLAEARRCVPSCEVEFDALHCLAGWFDRGFRTADADVVIPVGVHRLAGRAAFGSQRGRDDGARGSMIGHPEQVAWEGDPCPHGIGAGGMSRMGQGPRVLAVRRGETGVCAEVIASGESHDPVVTIPSSRQRWDHGGLVVDAA
ncbi:MAG: hypothetical protein K8S94_08935 [Planctomycetia bacterium]|nr:hypothetical protein [Planctomycetia bacterium]